MTSAFSKIRSAQTTRIDDNAAHFWSESEREAVVFALACQRPLLVRGEPGVGKSQLAYACAKELSVDLFPMVIRPGMEATEPLYTFDAVSRLAEAQILGAVFSGDVENGIKLVREQLDPEKFQPKGPLWQAMVQEPGEGKPSHWPRAVVLLDEIDKADTDLPNNLLEVFGNRSFQPPHGGPVRCDSHFPLVIATSNGERDLPPAFLRRCAVLRVQPSDGSPDSFSDWLCERAKAHTSLANLDESQMREAAAMVWQDRQRGGDRGKVGLAEFLDLLYAVQEIAGSDPALVAAELAKVRPYALQKHLD